MSKRKLLFNQVVALFLGNDNVKALFDFRLFSYNFDKKLILYDGKKFEVMFSGSQIKNATGYEFDFHVFKEVVHYFAKLNSPMPEETPDILLQPIADFLEKEELSRVQIRDIITNVFGGKMKDLTNRQLEMRIACCLSDLGWRKSRQQRGSFWLKEGDS